MIEKEVSVNCYKNMIHLITYILESLEKWSGYFILYPFTCVGHEEAWQEEEPKNVKINFFTLLM